MKGNNSYKYGGSKLVKELLSIVCEIGNKKISYNDNVKSDIIALINKGAKPTEFIIQTCSPFVEAINFELTDIVKLFIDNNADINSPLFYMYKDKAGMDITPLCLSAKKGLLNMTKWLIEHNASMEMRGNVRITPIHFATEQNHLEVVKYLLTQGAKYDVSEPAFNQTAYQLAEEKGFIEIVKLFDECKEERESNSEIDSAECLGNSSSSYNCNYF